MIEEEIKLIDGYFNKGWCCDLDEVYNTVMKVVKRNEQLEKRNKQLEKENEELKEDNKELYISNEHKKQNWVHKSVLNIYIPKSIIKEKIEELENYIQENSDEQGYWGTKNPDEIYNKIDVLEELLGDEQ